jgi:MOSC domain-containing protein YiiM
MTRAELLSVQTGPVAPLGPQALPSGIVKRPRQGPVTVTALGLEGDAQADAAVHGGIDKAVYAYSASHFPAWSARFPHLTFTGGAMGENLTIAGLAEKDICAGDLHRIGSALFQVCVPREPCFKFNLLHGDNGLMAHMNQTFQSGWYYRVLEPGALAAGDGLTLEGRPNPDFPFSRLVEIIYRRQGSRADLLRMSEMESLSAKWRQRAKAMLE